MGAFGTDAADHRGGGRRGLTILLALGLLAAALVLLPGRAGGALPNPPLFQLDGNATTQAADGPGDDWDNIFTKTSSAFSSSFIPESVEGPSVDTTYFTQGQKDTNDIPQWTPCGNAAPPKDELLNVMAGAYLNTNGHTIIYFGADRDSTNGDSNIGFWFNQDPSFGLQGTCPNQNFTGVHKDGDLFVVSAFTNGGTQPTIDVYQWQGGSLNPVSTGDASCTNPPNATNPACAIVNKAPISVPWSYKGTAPGTVDTNGFFEGGIDLTQLAGATAEIPCFTSYLGETRSSQELTATVKDFALGNLDSCGSIELKKHWQGAAGNTTINIGKTAGASNVGTASANGADGDTGAKQVNPGTYHVSETTPRNSSTTSPAGGYTTSLSCVNNKDPQNPVAVSTTPEDGNVPSGSQGDSLSVTSGDVIVCTYTNTFIPLTPTVTTAIHNAAHATVTTVGAGTMVHDSVSVSGSGGTPTGNVTFDWFTNGSCAGSPAATSGNVALSGSGGTATADATGFPQTPDTAGMYSFEAHYPGDATYKSGDGPCEPLAVVDAGITISPNAATNAIGDPHVFTAKVLVNSGSGGFVPAPNGTTVTFSKVSGPGTLTPSNGQCTTAGGTGTCTVSLVSSTAGVTTLSASTSVVVAGVTLNRATGDAHAGDGPNATKTWVDANINITPASATNPLGATHTFTATVKVNTGTGGYVAAPDGTVVTFSKVSGPGTFTPANGQCTTSGGTGTCIVTLVSTTVGTTVVGASTSVVVEGVTLNRATGDANAGDGGNATKNWVAAAISITKNPKSQTVTSGGTATFTIVVTNTGAVTLLNVHVTDGLAPDCAKTSASIPALASIAPGASVTYTCTLANVTSSFTNSATATGSPQGGGPDVSATDTAPVTVTTPPPPPSPPSSPQNPGISISKNPKSQTISPGGTATFTIVVTNTGNVTLTNVTVSDPLSPNCNQTSASIAALGSMAPGASVSYNCSLQNVAAGFTNVATASGTPPSGPNVTASDSAPVTVTAPLAPPPAPKPTPTHPAIDIVKDPKAQTIGQGGTATFKITVTNTGDVTLTDVTVSDPLSPDCNRNLGTLAVGKSKSYTCTKDNVTAAFQNVATATGKPPTGARVSAKDSANITVKAFIPPQHPHIAIAKNPNDQTVTTKLTTSAGNKTTVTYGTAHFTIKVTNTGDVTLHGVTVNDPRSTGCNKGLGSIAPHRSKTYSCTKTTVTSNFTNVATATGTSPKGVEVHASDSANVKVTTKTTSTSGAHFTG